MGGRFGGSTKTGQVQPRLPLPLDGDRRVVQIRLGPTTQRQDGRPVGQSLRENLEDGTAPHSIETDRGKEFYNKTFQQFLEKEGIHHFSTEGDAKASVVERFNRTLKTRMYRYFMSANTLRYEDVLQSLVRRYNATKHGSIGLPPQDVTLQNERGVWQRLYGRRLRPCRKKPRFRVGDRVRLNKKHRTFEKGYLPGWTEEVFTVDRVIRGPVHTYKIRELDDTPVPGELLRTGFTESLRG